MDTQTFRDGAYPVGKIELVVEINGQRHTISSAQITDFDIALDTIREVDLDSVHLAPGIDRVTVSWHPLRQEDGTYLQRRVEDLLPPYKDGEVVMPRLALGGSIARFEDRERTAMLKLQELGIYRVRKEKPHVLGDAVYRCFPRQNMPDNIFIHQGDRVMIRGKRVRIEHLDGKVTDVELP